jgi:hypothetical protein
MHAEGRRTRRLLSLASVTLPNKTNLCENCYKCSISMSPTATANTSLYVTTYPFYPE